MCAAGESVFCASMYQQPVAAYDVRNLSLCCRLSNSQLHPRRPHTTAWVSGLGLPANQLSGSHGRPHLPRHYECTRVFARLRAAAIRWATLSIGRRVHAVHVQCFGHLAEVETQAAELHGVSVLGSSPALAGSPKLVTAL